MDEVRRMREEASRLEGLAEAQENRELANDLIRKAECQEADAEKAFIKGAVKTAGKLAFTAAIAGMTGVIT